VSNDGGRDGKQCDGLRYGRAASWTAPCMADLVWTLLGAAAIPLWATWPALSLLTHEIPALECLAIVFLVAWVVTAPLEQAVRPPDMEPASWRWWIPATAFGLAEAGSAGFFLLATGRIAAAEANLLVYLWPAIVVSGRGSGYISFAVSSPSRSRARVCRCRGYYRGTEFCTIV
jgi:hypothetical protein